MAGPTNYSPYYQPLHLIPAPRFSESGQPVPAPAPATCPQSGDPAEQACYAEQLQLGIGVEKNVEEAFKWYTKAADSGHKASLLALADLYLQGFGADVDSSTKIGHLEAAGNLDHAGALNALGEIYEEKKDLITKALFVLGDRLLYYTPNLSSPKNVSKAFTCYKKASELGCREAYANLGRCFHLGRGTEEDEATALVWASLAAAEGSAEGMYRAGLIHLRAKGDLADLPKAISYLEQAAKLDHAPAQYQLGRIYGPNGQKPDPSLAFEWASKSASGGYGEGLALLGWYQQHGTGTQKSEADAFKSYRAGAERGSVGAMFSLGWFYYYGLGTNVQLKKAHHWFLEAGKRGHGQAQYCLARCYRHGQGCTPDDEWADIWLGRARDQGVTHIKEPSRKA